MQRLVAPDHFAAFSVFFGDGDGEFEVVGDGLATGVAVLVGDAAAGVGAGVVSVAGSQATVNPIAHKAISESVERVITLASLLVIVLPSFQTRLKSGLMIANREILSNECSHSCLR